MRQHDGIVRIERDDDVGTRLDHVSLQRGVAGEIVGREVDDIVLGVEVDDRVVAEIAVVRERVLARACREKIVALAAGDRVLAAARSDDVVARTAGEHFGARAADEVDRVRTGNERVAAAAARDRAGNFAMPGVQHIRAACESDIAVDNSGVVERLARSHRDIAADGSRIDQRVARDQRNRSVDGSVVRECQIGRVVRFDRSRNQTVVREGEPGGVLEQRTFADDGSFVHDRAGAVHDDGIFDTGHGAQIRDLRIVGVCQYPDIGAIHHAARADRDVGDPALIQRKPDACRGNRAVQGQVHERAGVIDAVAGGHDSAVEEHDIVVSAAIERESCPAFSGRNELPGWRQKQGIVACEVQRGFVLGRIFHDRIDEIARHSASPGAVVFFGIGPNLRRQPKPRLGGSEEIGLLRNGRKTIFGAIVASFSSFQPRVGRSQGKSGSFRVAFAVKYR